MIRHTLSHLAGPAITASGRVIQRCSICGAKLADSLNCAMPLEPDGSTPTFPTWPVGRFVRVTTGIPGFTEHTVLDDTDRLPEDTCLDTI